MRKIIFIIIVILILSLGILAVYVFALKDRGTGSESPFEISPGEVSFIGTGTSVSGPLAPMTSYPVAGYRVLASSVIAVGSDGVVEELDFTGASLRELGIINLRGIARAEVSPDGGTIALLLVDPATQEGRWYLWKSESGTLELLPANVEEISFSPSGRLLRQETKETGTALVVVEAGGSSQTVLSSTIPDLTAAWIGNERISLMTRPSGFAPGILYVFNTRTRATTRLLGGRFGLTARTDSGAQWTLFSETRESGKGAQLKVLREGTERTLRAATLPERCTFRGASAQTSSARAICSVFDTPLDARVMPDEYLRGDFANVSSDIMEIDLASGEERPLAENIPQDASVLSFSQDGGILFFVDKKDGALWRLTVE
jgi:hypothetical protein